MTSQWNRKPKWALNKNTKTLSLGLKGSTSKIHMELTLFFYINAKMIKTNGNFITQRNLKTDLWVEKNKQKNSLIF